jgi:hypothetical protein
MKIIWIAGKPYVEDERAWNGLRKLTPHEMEELGYHD